jgi:hypothetical protein
MEQAERTHAIAPSGIPDTIDWELTNANEVPELAHTHMLCSTIDDRRSVPHIQRMFQSLPSSLYIEV